MTDQNQDQPKQQIIVFVSPNGSRVLLPDAIKPEYLGWSIRLEEVESVQAETKEQEYADDQ